MRISTTTNHLDKIFGFKRAIEILAAAGYDCLDFNVFREEHYKDVHDKKFYVEIRKYAESKGIVFNQSHAPFASSFEDVEQTEQRFQEIVTAMKNASYLGVENIVVAQTEDIILVCDKNRAQDIKLIPETLAASGKDSYC